MHSAPATLQICSLHCRALESLISWHPVESVASLEDGLCTAAECRSQSLTVAQVYHKLEEAKFLLRTRLHPVLSRGSSLPHLQTAMARKHKRKNYYEVLGVPSVASQLEIKKAMPPI